MLSGMAAAFGAVEHILCLIGQVCMLPPVAGVLAVLAVRDKLYDLHMSAAIAPQGGGALHASRYWFQQGAAGRRKDCTKIGRTC